ncbi:MAG: helix-turn-helix domain-containing protein [Prevotella sp.]|nr:helix-turn-helix domain-containing protein [Prevotella sp.]MCI2087237.1 helix-turn-helix domain-containing protein [Prevotella sp.]MCI2124597.1 helix-turn-helix domain-containing protein [Prevotella sp.]
MNIQSLLESGANVTVSVTPLDLREFATYLISQVQAATDDKEEPESYLTPDEVAEMIGVSKNTLWRWDKEHYLTPVKVGRKSRYKRSDVVALMSGKSDMKKAVTGKVTA